jgi:hypothetical protein
MTKWHVFSYSLLGAVIAAQTAYIHELRAKGGDVPLAAVADAVDSAPPQAIPTAAPVVANPPRPVAAPCPRAAATPEELERAARRALEHQRDADALATKTALDEQVRRSRETVAERLALAGDELTRLETLGDSLRDAEASLRTRFGNGELPDGELSSELAGVWNKTLGDVEHLLGHDRYAEFQALRSEHPELGRSLYVFRSIRGDTP